MDIQKRQPTVKVGVRGFTASGPAETFDDIEGARNVVWVEVQGVRIENPIISVSWKGTDGFHTVHIEVPGVPEFVFLDKDAKEYDG